jgi:hypothetical protein
VLHDIHAGKRALQQTVLVRILSRRGKHVGNTTMLQMLPLLGGRAAEHDMPRRQLVHLQSSGTACCQWLVSCTILVLTLKSLFTCEALQLTSPSLLVEAFGVTLLTDVDWHLDVESPWPAQSAAGSSTC